MGSKRDASYPGLMLDCCAPQDDLGLNGARLLTPMLGETASRAEALVGTAAARAAATGLDAGYKHVAIKQPARSCGGRSTQEERQEQQRGRAKGHCEGRL